MESNWDFPKNSDLQPNSVKSNHPSLNYQSFKVSGCKDKGKKIAFTVKAMVNSFADNLTISLFISRLIFAVIWYLIALIHGDLEPDNLPQNQVIINSVKVCTLQS